MCFAKPAGTDRARIFGLICLSSSQLINLFFIAPARFTGKKLMAVEALFGLLAGLAILFLVLHFIRHRRRARG
ncbi:MAG: hypothetical protein HGA66_15530 [Holophaga sp.]|nr:hypothetical protein [Holophaga sp.]